MSDSMSVIRGARVTVITIMLAVAALAAATLVPMLASSQADAAGGDQGRTTVHGEPVAFGQGTATSWYTYHAPPGQAGTDGVYPVALGFTIDDGFLAGWPDAPSDGAYDIYDGDELVWPCCGFEVLPPLPDLVAETTAFDHLVVNVNPEGHPPPMVYSLPHLDVHFYIISPAERAAITTPADASEMCDPMVPLTCEVLESVLTPLPYDQRPPGYVSVGAVEPGMGNHLLDLSAPEFNGQVFDNTFLFGSNQGHLTFFEPMLTRDYLLGLSGKDCRPVATPAALPEAGWYPTRYCVHAKEGRLDISLDTFAWFKQSDGVIPAGW